MLLDRLFERSRDRRQWLLEEPPRDGTNELTPPTPKDPVEINKNTYKIDYKNIKDGLYYQFHNEKKDVVGFHLTWNDLEQHYELDYEKNLLDEWKAKGSRDVYAIGKEKKIFKINNKKYIFQPKNEQVYEELIFYNDNTGTHTRFEFPNTDDERE